LDDCVGSFPQVEDWKTWKDWGQAESLLAFRQLDKFEENVRYLPDFPDFRTAIEPEEASSCEVAGCGERG
jgi:hypothetical protein